MKIKFDPGVLGDDFLLDGSASAADDIFASDVASNSDGIRSDLGVLGFSSDVNWSPYRGFAYGAH
jgi:hypothetical protein